MKIAIINGPNLNLLGKREPDIYGSKGFDEYILVLKEKFKEVDFFYFQSNVEGEIINYLQYISNEVNGIVLNPAGYSHTSVAIRDTIAALQIPVVEVHISNIFAREEFRAHSMISAKVRGVISGLGLKGYELAIYWLVEKNDIKMT
ncbi:MAG: type II 3-dehydroquinate dehydratase [Sediminibacterium sp.]|nr:type II 3-dehydroquinate dehydratase [Sediminibacterium sp.]